MSLIRIGGALLCIADESAPFFYRGRRFVVNKQLGPVAINKDGDPLAHQPSGRMLQGAYDHFVTVRAIRP